MSQHISASADGGSPPRDRDAPSVQAVPRASEFEGPVQIITVNESGDGFTLHAEKVRHVLKQVPADCKVAVVSVVGAFRTGKSFLLDMMLRYLRYYEEHPDAIASPESTEWMFGEDAPLEGESNSRPAPDYSRVGVTAGAAGSGAAAAAAAPGAATPVSGSGSGSATSGESVGFGHAAAEASAASGGAGAGAARSSSAAAAAAGSSSSAGAGSSAGAVRAGFKWRAGKERTTTGIWLWSRAFIRTLPPRPDGSGGGGKRERVALLLMDTQGLWDTHTAQNLTTAIFALSTLISSHVIYNLTGRIQEDALQNLALFSQFGKRVLTEQRARARQAVAAGVEEEEAIMGAAAAAAGAGSGGSGEGGIADVVASGDDAAASGGSPATAAAAAGDGPLRSSSASSSSGSASAGASLDVLKSPGERLKQLRARTSRRMADAAADASGGGGGSAHPFQRIDLLVRDVQDLASDFRDLAAVEAENAGYLEREVLKRGALAASSAAASGSGSSAAAGGSAAPAPVVHEDIRSVREVIADAFACVGCFQLPHPGLHVPKPSFDGSLRSLEVDFRALVCHFMHSTFNVNLAPKRINGADVTGRQLGRYVEAYARLFQERAVLPEARMLLDAVADANSRNALDDAMARYSAAMEASFTAAAYAKDAEVERQHEAAAAEALELFDLAANFGTSTGIARYRSQLEESLAGQRARYIARNAERNPLRNAELYVFALAVAVGAYVLRLLVDWTCAPWADVCRRGSQLFGFVYTIIFLGAVVAMYFTGRRSWERVSAIVNALLAVGGAAAGTGSGGSGGAGGAFGHMLANVTSAAASAMSQAAGSASASSSSRPSPTAGAGAGTTAAPASNSGSAAAGSAGSATAVAGLRRRRSNGEA